MKRCFKCGVEKSLSDFYKHAHMGDGHLNKCKDCTKKDNVANRSAKLDYYREYDRGRAMRPDRVAARKQYNETERGKEVKRGVNTRYRAVYRDRLRARDAVCKAVKSGAITKQPCFVCGQSAEAHHVAYDMPLDVVWLCRPHHQETHDLAKSLP